VVSAASSSSHERDSRVRVEGAIVKYKVTTARKRSSLRLKHAQKGRMGFKYANYK